MKTEQKATLIPEFKRIFNEVQMDSLVVKKLSQHSLENQHKIFHAFKEIFTDEILFVITAYEEHAKQHSCV